MNAIRTTRSLVLAAGVMLASGTPARATEKEPGEKCQQENTPGDIDDVIKRLKRERDRLDENLDGLQSLYGGSHPYDTARRDARVTQRVAGVAANVARLECLLRAENAAPEHAQNGWTHRIGHKFAVDEHERLTGRFKDAITGMKRAGLGQGEIAVLSRLLHRARGVNAGARE